MRAGLGVGVGVGVGSRTDRRPHSPHPCPVGQSAQWSPAAGWPSERLPIPPGTAPPSVQGQKAACVV